MIPPAATAWLAGKAWTIAGLVGIAASLWLGVSLISAKIELRLQATEIEELRTANTDLTADLAQAHTNVETLQGALDRLSGQILSLQRKSAARLAASEQALAVARRRTVDAEARAAEILTHRPEGATEGERLLDVDRRFAESLQ